MFRNSILALFLILALLPHHAKADTCQMYTGTVPTSSSPDGAMGNITCNKQGQITTSGGTSPAPAAITRTDRSGSITTGGTAQNALSSNTSRKVWCVQNDPNAPSAEILYVNAAGTASATTGVALTPSQQVCNQGATVEQGAISVYATTTGHKWFASEGQ